MIVVNKNNFFVQIIKKAPGAAVAPKNTFYANHKLCLVLEGEAVWEIEDQTYPVRAGDIVLLKPGQKRHLTKFGKNGFKLCAFVLTRNAFSGMHHFMFFAECIKRQQNVMRSSPLSPVLQEIYEEWQTESFFRYELASAKLTEFFVKAEKAEGYSFAEPLRGNREMLELMDYIDANITNGICLSAAAKKAGMTESSFSRRFSAVNGISFKQYVIEKKIQRAIFLLQTTNRKVIDIASECGFDSISGFYDSFKRITGTTPNKFTEIEI